MKPLMEDSAVKALQSAALAMLAGCLGTSAYAQGLIVTRAEVPNYPIVALTAGLVSTVRVAVTVKNGTVSDLTVLTLTGSEAFARSTLTNIRTWKFAGGVDTTFVTTFTYEMADTAAETLENPRVELRLPFYVRLVGSRPKPWVIRDAAPIRSKPPLR
jgi:TonB family protein